jgi:hypothetical protein
MALTFRSTTPETKIVVDRASNGRQRVGRAVQSAHNPRWWDITIENPSGRVTPASFHGTGLEAVVAIADLMNRDEHEYETERQRSDRKEQPYPDRSVGLDEQGNNIGGAAIKNYLSKR